MTSVARAYIHAGFARTATTLLQRAVFPQLTGFYTLTNESPMIGGLLAYLKNLDQPEFDAMPCRSIVGFLHDEYIKDAKLILSDETLIEPVLLLNGTPLIPKSVLASRLQYLFPNARIMLTIRNQFDYTISKFNMLAHNAAIFAGVELSDFHKWLGQEFAQYRSLHLMNLNFIETIDVFETTYGIDNVCVCPMEFLSLPDRAAYTARIADFLEIDAVDIPVSLLQKKVNASRTDAQATPVSGMTELSDAERQQISRRCAAGNAIIADKFDLDLRRLGYPMPSS